MLIQITTDEFEKKLKQKNLSQNTINSYTTKIYMRKQPMNNKKLLIVSSHGDQQKIMKLNIQINASLFCSEKKGV